MGRASGTAPEQVPRARARFDDLRPGGVGFELLDPFGELVARHPEEVTDVVRAAELAAQQGAWVAGFVGYEAAAGFDPALPVVTRAGGDPLAGLPLAWFGLFRRRQLVAPLDPDTPGVEDGPRSGEGDATDPLGPSWEPDRGREWHANAVVAIREAIARGDYYQLNLTARLVGQLADPARAYAAVAATQRGAHHALLDTGEFAVVSASPELFFARTGNRLTVRPMKGTAARGRWSAEDSAAALTLRDSPKERAENTMIVDLLRNDLGRIAEVGSVRVSELFAVEKYPTVWQLTSTITAAVPATTDLVDVFTALFPSGSVTGAPKRAAMAAISQLEQRPRGVYCGAIGYLEPSAHRGVRPDARFNVAIRTITQALGSGYAEYGAGGAVTYPSVPDAEWSELLTKTAVLRPPSRSPRPAGLLETLRFSPPGLLVNLDRHLDRLSSSADYFEFRCDRAAVVTALSSALAERTDPARVRIVLRRSGEAVVEVEDLPPSTGTTVLAVADAPVRSDDVLLFHKHSDRRYYNACRATHPDADEVILWNERGEVTETTIANLAVRLDDVWWTPPLHCGLLPGVERARLLAIGSVRERVISIDELHGAESLALISSLRGWRPARLLAGVPRSREHRSTASASR